jgi:hypothetical protein
MASYVGKDKLRKVLDSMNTSFSDLIDPDSDIFSITDLGEVAKVLNEDLIARHYEGVRVLMPLKQSGVGSDVGVFDRNKVIDYVQLDSGLCVPRETSEQAELPYKPYIPPRRMFVQGAF